MNDDAIADLRASSRAFVRELGFMTGGYAPADVTHSQCHALLELDRTGLLSSGELAERLLVDKSTASRLANELVDKGLVAAAADPADRRRKLMRLLPEGQRRVATIDTAANRQVGSALGLLSADDAATVVAGMRLYAKALRRLRLAACFDMRPITPEDDPGVARVIRTVMPEFGADGPGTALHDPEVGAMHAAYAQDGTAAGYWVVVHRDTGEIVGGGGYGPLAGTAPGTVCELRKMYFLPVARGLGLGRALLQKVLDAATAAGYARCYLETMEHMTHARRLYAKFGFEPRDRPCGATGHHACDAWYDKALTG